MKQLIITSLAFLIASILHGQCEYEIENIVNPDGGHTTITPKDQGRTYGNPITFYAHVQGDTIKYAYVYLTTSSLLTFAEQTAVSFQFEDDSLLKVENINVGFLESGVSSADGIIYYRYSALIPLTPVQLSNLSEQLVKSVWFGQTKSNEYLKGIRKKMMNAAKCLKDL